MRFVLFALILISAAGCDVDGCETFVYDGPAILVTVRDAATGDPLSDGVTVEAQGVGRSEQFSLIDTLVPMFGGFSTLEAGQVPAPTGTYRVTVAAEGYEEATALADVVADDMCFSTPRPSGPVELTIELAPMMP